MLLSLFIYCRTLDSMRHRLRLSARLGLDYRVAKCTYRVDQAQFRDNYCVNHDARLVQWTPPGRVGPLPRGPTSAAARVKSVRFSEEDGIRREGKWRDGGAKGRPVTHEQASLRITESLDFDGVRQGWTAPVPSPVRGTGHCPSLAARVSCLIHRRS